MEIKQILAKYFKEHNLINIPKCSKLLQLPIYRCRIILFDLEREGFIKSKFIQSEKNTSYYWELNKEHTIKENDKGVSE